MDWRAREANLRRGASGCWVARFVKIIGLRHSRIGFRDNFSQVPTSSFSMSPFPEINYFRIDQTLRQLHRRSEFAFSPLTGPVTAGIRACCKFHRAHCIYFVPRDGMCVIAFPNEQPRIFTRRTRPGQTAAAAAARPGRLPGRHNFETLYECLVYLPYGCPHVLSFGFSFYCQHPDRAAIAARTKPVA